MGPQAEVYPYAPPVYTYQYSVSDPDVSGSVFSAQEARNDLEASGDYKVALPDGRTQLVSYSVSGPEGGSVVKAQPAQTPLVVSRHVHAPVVVHRPVHTPVVVSRPVHAPLAVHRPVVSRPVFHSAPLSVAPSSLHPVVHNHVASHPVIRPFVRTSPVVFHPAPTPAKSSVTPNEKKADDEQEERKAKEALVIEDQKSTSAISADDSGVFTWAGINQPTTTLAPATQPPSTQQPITLPPRIKTPTTQPPTITSAEPIAQKEESDAPAQSATLADATVEKSIPVLLFQILVKYSLFSVTMSLVINAFKGLDPTNFLFIYSICIHFFFGINEISPK